MDEIALQQWIEGHRQELLTVYKEILRVPAISPEFGGEGEYDKAQAILHILNEWGWGTYMHVYDVPDQRAKKGVRPNLVVEYNPKSMKNVPWLVIVAHLDVVPAGERSLWTQDPFDPYEKDGRLYGRGTEDNGQAIISPMYALRYIIEHSIVPPQPIKLVLVADEECGSQYGIRPLIALGLFHADDLVLVPDSGTADGKRLQIAEKVGLWVKIHILGKQSHASLPQDGLNAHRVGNLLCVRLDQVLHEKFHETDPRFYSPISTFEPTKRVNRVENPNTVPGEDEVFWDCRLIPKHTPSEVVAVFKNEAALIAQEIGATIEISAPEKDIAPEPIPENAPIVVRMKRIIAKYLGGPVEAIGLGGGTCAAFFRRNGIPAVVWGHMDHVAHTVDEYCVIQNLFDDIKIYTALMLEGD